MNDNLYLLYINDGFEIPCSRKVSCYNSGAKLYPLQRKLGSYECAKNVLKYICNMISKTDTFASSVTGESLGTNQKLYYNKKFWFLSPRYSINSMLVK